MMNKSTAIAAIVVSLLLPAIAAGQENKLAFSTAVDLSYKKMDFELNSGGPSTHYKPNLWMFAFSPSIAYRGVFLTLGLERSLGDGTTSDIQTTSTVTPANFIDARVQRSENTLTLGYNVWEGLTLFGGYLRDVTDVTATWTLVTGGGQSIVKSTYTERGPYAGVGYGHRFDNKGSLSASVAYARGKGHLSEQVIFAPGGFNEGNADGDVRGTSYSASWSAPLTGSLYYRLGLKVTRYDFTYRFGPAGIAPEVTTKQNYNSFILGVANYF